MRLGRGQFAGFGARLSQAGLDRRKHARRQAQAGQHAFHLIRRLREELKVNTTCGASNVSFGLPNREGINAAFLPMAIAAGMTSAITNPMMPEVKASVMAADVLMGHDPDCGRWITVNRAPTPEGEVSRRRVNRRAVPVG